MHLHLDLEGEDGDRDDDAEDELEEGALPDEDRVADEVEHALHLQQLEVACVWLILFMESVEGARDRRRAPLDELIVLRDKSGGAEGGRREVGVRSAGGRCEVGGRLGDRREVGRSTGGVRELGRAEGPPASRGEIDGDQGRSGELGRAATCEPRRRKKTRGKKPA